jgi:hypothetical protein
LKFENIRITCTLKKVLGSAEFCLGENIGLKMALGNKRLKNYIKDRDKICIPLRFFLTKNNICLSRKA